MRSSDWSSDVCSSDLKQERRTVSVALTDQALGRTDLAGKAATALAPLANKAIATPGSRARKAMEKVTGIASQRVLPPYAKTRFSTWWKKRTALRAPAEEKQGDRTSTRLNSSQ